MPLIDLVLVHVYARMAMNSEVQSQMSKRIGIAVGGNLAVTGNSGRGAATAVLKHQISSVASIELMASAGLHSLIGIQTTRYLTCIPFFYFLFFISYFYVCTTSFSCSS